MVVGTVVDPEMREELRVTVVATGLGRTASVLQQDGAYAYFGDPVATGLGRTAAVSQSPPRKRPSRTPPAAAPDYSELEKPTVVRKKAVGDDVNDVAEDVRLAG